MHPVHTENGDVLAFTTASFARTAAGLAVAAGGALLVALAALAPIGNAGVVGFLALLGVGLGIGGGIALLRALNRAGIVLDRLHRRVTTWRRAILRMSTETRSLEEFWTVLVSVGRAHTRYTSRTVYVVGLHGEVGEPMMLHWDHEYLAAHRLAQHVATYLGLPCTNACTAQMATPLAPSLLEQPPELPADETDAPPSVRACRLSRRGDTLLLEERAAGWKALIGIPLLLFLVAALSCVGVGTLGHYLREEGAIFADPLVAALITVAMLFVLLVVVVVSSLPQLGRRRLVEAGPAGLHFRIQGAFATVDRALRAEDIVDLRVALGHLCAITPRDLRVVCGTVDRPLPRAELEWLRGELGRALKTAPRAAEDRYWRAR